MFLYEVEIDNGQKWSDHEYCTFLIIGKDIEDVEQRFKTLHPYYSNWSTEYKKIDKIDGYNIKVTKQRKKTNE